MSTSILALPSHMAGFLHELGPPASGVYTFVSYPAAILPNRPKYRSDLMNSNSSSTGGNGTSHINIMADRRVVRGNTYSINQRAASLRAWNVSSTDDDIVKHRQSDRRGYVRRRVLPHIGNRVNNVALGASSRSNGSDKNELRADRLLSTEAQVTAARARVRKRLINYQNQNTGNNVDGSGRRHLDVQTERWLEEIKDRAPEVEAAVQTDDVIFASSRPNSASRSLTKCEDKATQILPDDPDLFAFDEEVAIVLEALVGRTLEQSLLEVIEEEEELLGVEKMRLEEIESS